MSNSPVIGVTNFAVSDVTIITRSPAMVVLAGFLYALVVTIIGGTFGCLGVTPIVVTSGLRLCVAVALAGGPVARWPVAGCRNIRNIQNMWKISRILPDPPVSWCILVIERGQLTTNSMRVRL